MRETKVSWLALSENKKVVITEETRIICLEESVLPFLFRK
jgi:hypothetical protein